MLTWLNFLIIFFWLSFFSFFIAPLNFFFLIMLSEVIWVILYSMASIAGSIIDELTCFSISFFILGFASIELCFGLLLLIVLKQLGLSINLLSNSKVGGLRTFERLLAQLKVKPRV